MILTAVFFAPFACAKTESLSFGLKIWYPDEWQCQSEPTRMIVRSPDGAAIAMFYVLETGDIMKAQDMMGQELSRIFTTINVLTQPTPSSINKLEGIILDGTGIIDKVFVFWVGRLVVYKGKALMVLGCAESTQFSASSDTIRKIIESIKR
ncbi:MAG: hypothetical protein PHP46_03720 [Candidatus Omnitrophica bacterium]|nr:hypothetical protein [Candidatus Omnitrophota bacterium]